MYQSPLMDFSITSTQKVHCLLRQPVIAFVGSFFRGEKELSSLCWLLNRSIPVSYANHNLPSFIQVHWSIHWVEKGLKRLWNVIEMCNNKNEKRYHLTHLTHLCPLIWLGNHFSDSRRGFLNYLSQPLSGEKNSKEPVILWVMGCSISDIATIKRIRGS